MSGAWPPDGLRFLAQRERDPHADVASTLTRLGELVATWAGGGPLSLAGNRMQSIEANAAGVAAYLHDVRRARARGEIEVFSLAEHAGPDAAMLFYDWEEGPQLALERVWVPAPPGGIPPGRVQQSIALAGRMGEVFGAATVFTEDFTLMRLTRGKRAVERARERMPEELRGLVPDDEPDVPPTDVAQLLVPEEFDRRFAPEGIWWVNYWSRPVIESVGVERVRGAPWAEVRELSGDALLLVATPHPLDPVSTDDLRVVDHLLRELQIRDVQDRHRLSA